MMELLLGLAEPHGYLLRRDAIALGATDAGLRRLVRSGVIERIRQGAYAPREQWRDLSRPARHIVLCRAVMDQYDEHVALSHSSQAIADGAPDWGLDLDSVHLTHLTGGGRRTAGVVHHEGGLRVGDLRRAETGWATTPARTVLDTCGLISTEAGVVLANWYLNQGLTTSLELDQRYNEMLRWRNMIAVRLVLMLADGRMESVGESRFLYLVWKAGLPLPIAQWEVWHNGKLVGIVDFAWPELGLMVEFDGRIKYGALLKPGQTAEDVVFAEKRREDALREVTGFRMMRVVWSDLENSAATVHRLKASLRRAA